jgi:hypothetical protein
MGVPAAKQLGAERIIAMSRNPQRQGLARYQRGRLESPLVGVDLLFRVVGGDGFEPPTPAL